MNSESSLVGYLTTAQAARLMGVSSERVRQLLRSGKLPSVSTPLGRLVLKGDVEQRMRKLHRIDFSEPQP